MTTETGIEQWRDKKRYLWLMGLIAPTALFAMLPLVWVLNQAGWHGAALAMISALHCSRLTMQMQPWRGQMKFLPESRPH